MKTISLLQGSPEWLAHRRTTRNASDAPAMMGVSPYVTRSDLVRQYATGVQREVDEQTQRVFDRGHEVEPRLRAYAEGLINEDLYPITGVNDDGYLGASFDGVNLDETIILEAKQSNAEKIRLVQAGQIPPQDYWQVVQQFAVCVTAESCLYVVGDGSADGTVHMEILRTEVVGDIPKLLAGWKQFDEDVAAYQPEPVRAAPMAAPVEGFGALSLRVEGRIVASNLDVFKAGAEAFIARLPKPDDLQTDQDFADAKAAVKACEEAEGRIKAAKDAAQSEMTDVDAAFRLADTVSQTIRAARLALDKVVKVEEQARKDTIVQDGVKAVRAHYDTINETLGEHRIQPAQSLQLDLGAAIKGKKSLASMKDAVNIAVAGFKIAASEQAERVRANVRVLEMEQGTWAALFHDRVQLCATKSQEDLRNLIVLRIQEAKDAEDRRQEEQRRKDEQAQTAAQESPQVTPHAEATAPALASVPTSPVPARSIGGSATKIELGDINARLAPITITADGLAKIGIQSAAKQGGATLYLESDFPRICSALTGVLASAMQRKAA